MIDCLNGSPLAPTMELHSLTLTHSHNFQSLTLKPNNNHSTNKRKPLTIISKQDLQGKSVAVIGLGKSGEAASKLALARGASSVVAVDQNLNVGFSEQDSLLKKHGSFRTILGDFDGKLLWDMDVVVVSPGVPIEKYGLLSLLQSGKQVMSELDFAAQVLPKRTKILAVTGTNGKSTVVTFAGQMLNCLGIEAFVGGNLGNPLSLAALQSLGSSSLKPKFQVAVVEVSSYQMEIPHNYFCPSVAVLLNLTPDHLERHKTMENYAAIKCRLLSHMTNSKMGLISSGNQYLNEAISEHMNGFNLAWIGSSLGLNIDMEAKVASLEVPAIGIVSQLELGALKAIGTHNYHNAAVAALSVLGLDVGVHGEAISSTIGNLRAPPHRMEIVRKDSNGVLWINDSKATNAEAAYTGLMGLKGQKSVILLGGLAKDLIGQETNGFEQLVEPLQYHRCVITFGSSGPLIHKTLCDNGLSIPCFQVANLEDAVNCAQTIAKHGDAIVLSPGCASFDEFRNFEHRGMVFRDLALSS